MAEIIIKVVAIVFILMTILGAASIYGAMDQYNEEQIKIYEQLKKDM